jgi:hypothetical protein
MDLIVRLILIAYLEISVVFQNIIINAFLTHYNIYRLQIALSIMTTNVITGPLAVIQDRFVVEIIHQKLVLLSVFQVVYLLLKEKV